jgi:hypothetical protein
MTGLPGACRADCRKFPQFLALLGAQLYRSRNVLPLSQSFIFTFCKHAISTLLFKQ